MEKNESITIRLPKELKETLEKRAKENYRTLSQEIRLIIEKYIEENK